MTAESQSPTMMVKPLSGEFEFHLGRGWLTSETSLVKPVNENDANGYYKTFGLSPSATRQEIKTAYRKLVKKLHPDRGGDEELYRFVVEIASVLLNPRKKKLYDSVGGSSIYLGDMECEELARAGVVIDEKERIPLRVDAVIENRHWACLTTSDFLPGEDTDAWIDFCGQVSSAVGYRGKIRVGVVEGGWNWPYDRSSPWGILIASPHNFVVFQRGFEPNRLHALCAMIEWQKRLLNQTRRELASAQNRERQLWL